MNVLMGRCGGGVKGLRKVVIEGGDHLPMISAPERLLEVCLGVVDGIA